MDSTIREIKSDDEIKASLAVVRESFGTVAREFNLTIENCPTHPSFLRFDRLKELHNNGQRFYGLFEGEVQVGFAAMGIGDEGSYYLEKLAVIPQSRHHGYGERLVNSVLDQASAEGASRLSIGIIDEHAVLKDWYKGLGFVGTGTKKFSHLPFTVGFMEINLAERKLKR